MSDSPAASESPASESPASASSSDSRHKNASRDRGSLITAVVAVLAIAALGLSAWALQRTFSGGSASAPEYSDSQRADAKTKVCTAFQTVRRGVSRNTHLQIPGGDADVAGTLAGAANARISLYDGGQYLLARLDPATPSQLADAVRGFANALMDIGAAVTAGGLETDPDQVARLRDAEAANNKVAELCA